MTWLIALLCWLPLWVAATEILAGLPSCRRRTYFFLQRDPFVGMLTHRDEADGSLYLILCAVPFLASGLHFDPPIPDGLGDEA